MNRLWTISVQVGLVFLVVTLISYTCLTWVDLNRDQSEVVNSAVDILKSEIKTAMGRPMTDSLGGLEPTFAEHHPNATLSLTSSKTSGTSPEINRMAVEDSEYTSPTVTVIRHVSMPDTLLTKILNYVDETNNPRPCIPPGEQTKNAGVSSVLGLIASIITIKNSIRRKLSLLFTQ